MIIKKLNDFEEIYSINENLSDIFKKPTYEEKVRSSLMYIIMEEKQISEKSFDRIDSLINHINEFFKNNNKVKDIIKEFEDKKSRNHYCAEFIYDNLIKNNRLI